MLTAGPRLGNIRKPMFSQLRGAAMTISEPIPLVERSVSDSTSTQPAPRRRSLLPQPSCADNPMMGVALLAGPANVIMQLARPGVGYGVLESRVESGRVDLHPIKRARTTFTYLVVATQGSDEQKAAFREAVDSAHRQVRSTADSPVKYNAFDRDLQLWVGACLYKGNVDVHRIFLGEMDDEHADRHYHNGPPSTGTGRSNWTRCTSMTPSAATCVPSPPAGCAA